MKTLLALSWLLVLSHIASAAMITGVVSDKDSVPFEFFPKDQIRMRAAFDPKFLTSDTQRTEFDTRIFCSWTNVSKNDVKFLLKDHDNYESTLDYPWGIVARVTSKTGEVITKNTVSKEGWWSSSYIQSQLSELMPGDVVVLKPGETVVRCVFLKSILSGLQLNDPSKWAAGDYSIELSMGNYTVKPLTLRVGK